jgi:NADH-quinone oxidoreductase subunit F
MTNTETPLSVPANQHGISTLAQVRRVIICAGTGCMANGAMKVFERFKSEMAGSGLRVVLELRPEAANDEVRLSKSGCQGFCQMGPLVSVVPDGILYTKVRSEDVPDIVQQTLVGHQVVERLLYKDPATRQKCRGLEDNPFYARQSRFVLRECGFLDPEDIHEYILHGGYRAARKAFVEMLPEEICTTILDSGLRGRGGGGFPTGRKWNAARVQNSAKKYVICNGDEGDPGAFMNRSVMEGNPHSVLEGLIIAARAIGANETLVYVRAEYPLAVERMRRAVADAEREGILGKNVFGTGLSMKCEVMEGAGAFVCGEETAMIASIEGQRGMPQAQAALSRAERTVGQADHHQQRRDAGTRFPHSQRRAGGLPQHRNQRVSRHQDVSLSPGTSPTRAWSKFRSVLRCARSSTTSAAE